MGEVILVLTASAQVWTNEAIRQKPSKQLTLRCVAPMARGYKCCMAAYAELEDCWPMVATDIKRLVAGRCPPTFTQKKEPEIT